MVSARLQLLVSLMVLATASVVAEQDPARADGWVVIPVDDYRALRAKAFPVDPAPPPPPVDAAVTRIDYDLTLGTGSATGTAAVTVDVLKDGWVRVQVPDGLLVSDARIDGRPVSLIDQPSPHVLLAKRGRSLLTLNVVLPVTAAASVESLVVPPAPAAAMQVTLTMPRVGVELGVSNAWISSTSESGGQSRWVAHGRGHEPLTFTWRRRVDHRRAEQPLRLRGSVTHLVGLGEDATQLTAAVRVDVVSGLTNAVTLAIPEDLRVNRVSGPTIADWETVRPGMLRVTLIEPLATTATFSVIAELRGPSEGIVPVPLIRLSEAERETGGIAVEVLGAGEITERQPQALEPADALDLGSIVAGRESPSMVAFRFKPIAGSAVRALAVRVTRYATQAVQVANVDEARYQVLSTEEGKTLVRARYAVRNNHRSLMSVALPVDATLWSVSVAGRVVRPGRAPSGALLVPLERGRSRDDLPPFVVEVVYLARVAPWSEKGTLALGLPAIDLPISRTGVALHHSRRFTLAAVPGSFRVEPYAEPFSAVLRDSEASLLRPPPPSEPVAAPSPVEPSGAAIAALVQSAREGQKAVRGVGILPLDIPFPEFGSTIYLASELTPETQTAELGLEYHRTRGN